MRHAICLLLLAAAVAAWAAGPCDPALRLGPPAPSGRILFDRGGEVWVMDGDARRQHKVLGDSPWSALSPDGIHIAHWSVNDGQVRVLSLDDGCDAVIDSLQPPPGDFGWSNDGHTLAYVGRSARGAGLHVLPFPVGAAVPKVFPYFSFVSLSEDGRYAIKSDLASVIRVDLRSGEETVVYSVDPKKEGIWGAFLARHGGMTAVLMIQDYGAAPVDEDEPDCSTGTTALRILTASGATVDVPFPEGFSSVLNDELDFSPDGKDLAIAFGAERCDYPGDVAAVYLFNLETRKLTRLSPEERLAARVKFSPDGKAVIYTDFMGEGTTRIYRMELPSGPRRPLTAPRQYDYDTVIDWR